jgi:hypothetical protein
MPAGSVGVVLCSCAFVRCVAMGRFTGGMHAGAAAWQSALQGWLLQLLLPVHMLQPSA